MAFQIKDFQSIAQSMINFARSVQTKITDFTVGSAVRTTVECAAIEIDEAYQQMWLGLKEGIPVALYEAFSFPKIPAQKAQGNIAVTVSAGTAFALTAGTRFTSTTSASVIYEAVADVDFGTGSGATNILVACSVAGVTTPVVGGSAFSVSIPRLVSAVAASDFTNGTEAETDQQRKQRFTLYIQNIGRSVETAMEYGAKTTALYGVDGSITEQVKYSRVVDVVISDVVQANCYIHNGVDGASGDLIDECDKILRGYTDSQGNKIPGWKAAGTKLVVASTTNVDVDVSGVVTTDGTVDHAAAVVSVKAAIDAYFATLDIGNAVIKAELIAAAMGVPGVSDFSLSAPSANVTVGDYEKAIRGIYAIT